MIWITLILGLAFLAVLWRIRQIVRVDARLLSLGSWLLLDIILAAGTITFILLMIGGWGWAVFALALATGIVIFLLLNVVIYFALAFFSWQIWRKEYHNLGNLLLPFAFLALSILNVLEFYRTSMPAWLQTGFVFVNLISWYLTWLLVTFALGAMFYARLMKKREADVYVVLGAGLINGHEVSRLLGNRIKAAVDAANAKYEATGKYPIIVFSGGKGGDEQLSEAQAMQTYAHEQLAYPLEQTRIEDRSRTTRENMRFSNELIEQEFKQSEFIFFTSEYHVFRAALQARQFGVHANGRGGFTPWYFRTAAFLREFIAVLSMHKARVMAVIGALTILGLVFSIMTAFIK
ncbi:MAG: YdcF family protein [Lactobacillaceae bacterium]|jgi:uncharacterized SAM-binding protein YcdF (DUF218 family)|nr:YdcF family protein [Lactobacillaceae bacterium]